MIGEDGFFSRCRAFTLLGRSGAAYENLQEGALTVNVLCNPTALKASKFRPVQVFQQKRKQFNSA